MFTLPTLVSRGGWLECPEGVVHRVLFRYRHRVRHLYPARLLRPVHLRQPVRQLSPVRLRTSEWSPLHRKRRREGLCPPDAI